MAKSRRQFQIRTVIFIIIFIITSLPVIGYLSAISHPEKTLTISAKTVDKDDSGLFTHYFANATYNVWVFSGDYTISITRKEYNKAIKSNCEIKEVNCSGNAESMAHATWRILPRIILTIILVTGYIMYYRKNQYLFQHNIEDDMWS